MKADADKTLPEVGAELDALRNVVGTLLGAVGGPTIYPDGFWCTEADDSGWFTEAEAAAVAAAIEWANAKAGG